jgi:hypothetical protein
MPRPFAAAALLLVIATGARAADFADVKEELAALTRSINESYIGRGDPAPTARLATENYRFVLFNGGVESKQQVVTTIGGLKTTSFEEVIESVDVTGDTGIVISRILAPGTLNGQPALETPTRSTMIWSRLDGQWRLVGQTLHMVRPLKDMLPASGQK